MTRLKKDFRERLEQRQREKLITHARERIAQHHKNIESIESGGPPMLRPFGHSMAEKSLARSQRWIGWWTEYLLTGEKPTWSPENESSD